MITFEEAYKIAKTRKPDIDSCEEWKYAFIFGSTKDPFSEGGIGPCVVLKADGSILSWGSYWIKQTSGYYGDDELIREIKL